MGHNSNTTTVIYKVVELYDLHNYDTESFCMVFLDVEDSKRYLKNKLEKIVTGRFGIKDFEWNWNELKMDKMEISIDSNGWICLTYTTDYWRDSVTFYIEQQKVMLENKNKLWDDITNTSKVIYKVVELWDYDDTESFCTVFMDSEDSKRYLKNKLEKTVTERFGIKDFEWNWNELKMDKMEINIYSNGRICLTEDDMDYVTFYLEEDEINMENQK
ncbi:MAG: hypothetical protein IKS22_09475 [Bacteroidales bacterium]|nr:hypothetical protein [Bacteroidales bacterium]